jgi:hypothetical protein
MALGVLQPCDEPGGDGHVKRPASSRGVDGASDPIDHETSYSEVRHEAKVTCRSLGHAQRALVRSMVAGHLLHAQSPLLLALSPVTSALPGS